MKKQVLKSLTFLSLLVFNMPAMAQGVKWLEKCQDASKVEINKGTTSIENGVLKISGTDNQELKVTLKPGENLLMDNSQTYVVIEANTVFNNTKKLDHLNVGGTNYVNKSGVLLGFEQEVGGHQLTVFNILDKRGGNDKDKEAVDRLVNFLYNTESYNASEASFYLRPKTALADNAPIEIYNIGFYSFGDILTAYPELAAKTWRFQSANTNALEENSNSKTIKINNKAEVTMPYYYLKLRLLQNLPTGFSLDLRNVQLPTGQTPLKKDALANINVSKILVNASDYLLYPTMNNKVVPAGYKYYAYKDGIVPSSVNEIVDGGGSKGKAYSYTRNFKSGNNSCILPFDVETETLKALGLSAYQFQSVADGNINFISTTSTISAGTPLIIKAEEAGLYIIPAATTPNLLSNISGYKEVNDADGNKFIGSFVKEVPTTYTNRYELDASATSFMKMGEDINTTYYRAFLSIANPISEGKAFSITFDGPTTGITQVNNDQVTKHNDAYYNLQGIKMNTGNLPRGIYIHNGKKVVIK